MSMNKPQKAYMLAKANYETAKETTSEYEHAFIIREGITNGDGSIPMLLWMLEGRSEEYFDQCCDKLDSNPKYKQLVDEEREAKILLSAAEDGLIDYALSLPMPENVRETLRKNRNSYKVHDKLLDLAFRLDTRTVKA